jgi:hypothetical protein
LGTFNSTYYDPDDFIQKFKHSTKSVLISTNIHSITSEFSSLSSFITEITRENVPVAVIALQESWGVTYPELIKINGYQPIVLNSRVNVRGRGVGFSIKNGINCKIINTNSIFVKKRFKNLMVEIQLNDKKIILGNVYRSPNPPSDMTNSAALFLKLKVTLIL